MLAIEQVEVMKSKLTGNLLGFALIYSEIPENTKLVYMSLPNSSRLDTKNFMVEFPISPKQNNGLSSKPSTIPLSTPSLTPQTSPEVQTLGAGSSTFSFKKVDLHFSQAHCQTNPDNVGRPRPQQLREDRKGVQDKQRKIRSADP